MWLPNSGKVTVLLGVILLSLAISIAPSIADTPSVSVNSNIVVTSNTFTVNIKIDKNISGLKGVNVILGYDDSLLEIDSIVDTSPLFSSPVLYYSKTSGQINLTTGAFSGTVDGPGTLFSVTFRLKAGSGVSNLSLNTTQLRDAANASISLTTLDGASYIGSKSFPSSTAAEKWKMISVPLNLDNPNPGSVLIDDLGAQDDTVWKLYRWDTTAGSYDKYPSTVNFAPGRSFWLITKTSKTLDVEEGEGVDVSEEYSIYLDSGWNQIANPFPFSIDWGDVQVEKDGTVKDISDASNWIRDKIWIWNGSSYDWYQAPNGQAPPWEGGFVKTLTSCNLLISPQKTGVGQSLLQALSKSKNNLVQIIAKVEDLKDSNNFFGLLGEAKDDYDKDDVEEAPFPSPYISLFFPHPDWGIDSDSYTQDVRCATTQKEQIIWQMRVKTSEVNKQITLEWKSVESFPSTYYLYLTDEEEHILADMRKKSNYSYGTLTGEDTFKIIASLEPLSSSPEDLTLTEVYNYPNPCDSSLTNLHFRLGAEATVTIKIYTIAGELVKTVAENKTYSTGTHEEIWHLNTETGDKVASGVYILVVKASNSAKNLIKSNKIAVIK